MSLSETSMINLFSLAAINTLGKTQKGLSSSIEKLSTGLAINHASDAPSGLAISEKMRSYIKGLKQSSLNTQDGTSYLQTAEGATEQVVSMLQRMRELAVESANGSYTANDRTEIQKEMDQLKLEIDRISESAEFNTKKLLDGGSVGSWKSSSAKIGAVMTGPVNDGNYDISIEVTPGKNQVQQTNIMSIREGSLGAEIKNSGGVNISSVSSPENMAASLGSDYTVTVADAALEDGANVVGSYFQEGSVLFPGSVTAVETNASGYMVIEFTESSDTAGAAGTPFRAKFISAEDGSEGGWVNYLSGEDASLSATYTSGGFNVSFKLEVASGVNSTVREGDKILVAVTDNKGLTAGLLASGGGTLTLGRGGVLGPTVTYAGIGSLTAADDKDGIDDIKNVTLYSVDLDAKSGNVSKGKITLGFSETPANSAGHGMTRPGTMTFEIRGGGEAATSTTKLSDIVNFVDSEGNAILQNTQEIRIYGNSRYASVLIEGGDTVEELRQKLTDAIVSDLGMGSDDAYINKRLVEYVPTEGGSGLKAVRGTMLIQTALTGEASTLSFIGDQKMLDAFGLAKVQESINNVSKVSVSEHRSGSFVGELITDGDRAKNLIEGVDITIDVRAGAQAVWNTATDAIEFVRNTGLDNYNMNLHIVDTSTKIQVGAQKGQTVDVSIPQLDTVALGIDKSVITSQSEAQKSLAALDVAITKVNSVRSTIGAKINRLDSAYSSLQAARENLTASESRIRDTDIAAESAALTSAQVMSQAGVSMLAQANQMSARVLSLLQA